MVKPMAPEKTQAVLKKEYLDKFKSLFNPPANSNVAEIMGELKELRDKINFAQGEESALLALPFMENSVGDTGPLTSIIPQIMGYTGRKNDGELGVPDARDEYTNQDNQAFGALIGGYALKVLDGMPEVYQGEPKKQIKATAAQALERLQKVVAPQGITEELVYGAQKPKSTKGLADSLIHAAKFQLQKAPAPATDSKIGPADIQAARKILGMDPLATRAWKSLPLTNIIPSDLRIQDSNDQVKKAAHIDAIREHLALEAEKNPLSFLKDMRFIDGPASLSPVMQNEIGLWRINKYAEISAKAEVFAKGEGGLLSDSDAKLLGSIQLKGENPFGDSIATNQSSVEDKKLLAMARYFKANSDEFKALLPMQQYKFLEQYAQAYKTMGNPADEPDPQALQESAFKKAGAISAQDQEKVNADIAASKARIAEIMQSITYLDQVATDLGVASPAPSVAAAGSRALFIDASASASPALAPAASPSPMHLTSGGVSPGKGDPAIWKAFLTFKDKKTDDSSGGGGLGESLANDASAAASSAVVVDLTKGSSVQAQHVLPTAAPAPQSESPKNPAWDYFFNNIQNPFSITNIDGLKKEHARQLQVERDALEAEQTKLNSLQHDYDANRNPADHQASAASPSKENMQGDSGDWSNKTKERLLAPFEFIDWMSRNHPNYLLGATFALWLILLATPIGWIAVLCLPLLLLSVVNKLCHSPFFKKLFNAATFLCTVFGLAPKLFDLCADFMQGIGQGGFKGLFNNGFKGFFKNVILGIFACATMIICAPGKLLALKNEDVQNTMTDTKREALNKQTERTPDGPQPQMDLSPEKIATIKPEEMKNIPIDQIKTLTPEAIAKLTTDQIKAMTPQQVAALITAPPTALSSDQVKALTKEQLEKLTTAQATAIGKHLSEEQKDQLSADAKKTLLDAAEARLGAELEGGGEPNPPKPGSPAPTGVWGGGHSPNGSAQQGRQ